MPTARKPTHTRPAEENEGVGLRNEALRILDEAGLPPADRRVRFIDFNGGELARSSTSWAEAFDGAPSRFLSAPDFTPDLLLGASTSDFLIALRADLPYVGRARLVRHAAAHIAWGTSG